MADPGKGRGRGLALLDALKKSQHIVDSPPQSVQPSPDATPAPSAVGSSASASVVSASASSVGGRGRLLMFSKLQQKEPQFAPASDTQSQVCSSVSSVGAGRGLKLLSNLKNLQSKASSVSDMSVTSVTQQLKDTSIGDSPKVTSAVDKPVPRAARNRNFREVKDTPPVVRLGEAGAPCNVTANFVRLNFQENSVFEYEVKYSPDQDNKFLRSKLLYQHKDIIKENTFDGTILYLPHKLPDEVTSLKSKNPFDDSNVTLTIIFKRTRKLSEMVHLYNVLFKHIMKDLQLIRFGREHYSEHLAVTIPQHQLEVWPGYVTAVDEYEGGLMLTLDSTHRVLRTQTALDIIQLAIQQDSSNWQQTVSNLVGCSVMTTYNKKIYRVDSINYNESPRSTFERVENGENVKISYIDYYKKSYGLDIKDWNQPLFISRKTKRTPGVEEPTDFIFCLIPELCQMTGLTDEQRSNFHLMKDVATYTRITPNQRHAAFKKFIQNVLENDRARKRLEGWGLSIAPETIDLKARTLPPETLYFGRDVKVNGKPKADWNFDVTNNAVISAIDIMKWVVMCTRRDERGAHDFIDTMMNCSRPMGIRVTKPELVVLPSDNTAAYVKALRTCFSQELQLIVTICPNNNDSRYAAIKKICCADNPVASQVINARTLKNTSKIRSITQKIALQINCKLGGTLWRINIPLKKTMIVGIDSYHDGSRKKRSICGFVASYDAHFTNWYSQTVFHDRGQEIVDALKSALMKALTQFVRINGSLPDRIVIYRDGVGDGQLKTLADFEIPQLKISFKSNDNYEPALTYVVVQKRINSRIFLKLNGGFENPNPGTVLDHDVTRRDWYDFLIVSQKVNQGTVTPSHYVVVYDDSGMTPDQCQRLTYKLCHLYYNWPGTVRVPAPCQYAHKLAYLVGESIHQEPSDQLADRLFFL